MRTNWLIEQDLLRCKNGIDRERQVSNDRCSDAMALTTSGRTSIAGKHNGCLLPNKRDTLLHRVDSTRLGSARLMQYSYFVSLRILSDRRDSIRNSLRSSSARRFISLVLCNQPKFIASVFSRCYLSFMPEHRSTQAPIVMFTFCVYVSIGRRVQRISSFDKML